MGFVLILSYPNICSTINILSIYYPNILTDILYINEDSEFPLEEFGNKKVF